MRTHRQPESQVAAAVQTELLATAGLARVANDPKGRRAGVKPRRRLHTALRSIGEAAIRATARSVKSKLERRACMLLRDSQAAASAASLRYVAADELGIRRVKKGKGFVYYGPNGALIRKPETLARIRRLALPPAWREVRISQLANGHLQATGIDAKGRRQYRYHAAWRQVRDLAKFDDIVLFVRALPRLRQRLAHDLRQRTLTKTKVVAAVVSLMERTQLRVGNRRYAEENGSFGLTTLRDQHAHISGSNLSLRFRAKGGKLLDISLQDKRLARIVRKCRDIPGQTLFQYLDQRGNRHAVTSHDVNAYLQETMGHAFTAKEFRTWAASSLAALHLAEALPFSTQTAAKKTLVRAAEYVSKELGNTPSICRKCYIHPGIFDSYLKGELHQCLDAMLTRAQKRRPMGLTVQEAAVVGLLESLTGSPKELLALSA